MASFEIGDLVWAKMKGYPDWPGQITNPPKNAGKKGKQWVYFFGSQNSAWITDDKITHHSEEMLKSLPKKKYAFFEEAVDDIKYQFIKSNSIAKINVKEREAKPVTKKPATKKVKSPDSKIYKKDKKIEVIIPFVETTDKSSEENGTSLSPIIKKKYQSKDILKEEEKGSEKPISFMPEGQKDEILSAKSDEASQHKRPFLSGYPSSSSVKKPRLDYGARLADAVPTVDKSDIAVYNFNDDAEESIRPLRQTSPIKSDLKSEQEPKPPLKIIGFIGLGLMGQSIVTNLLEARHSVWVWNRTITKCDRMVKLGANRASTLCELVKNSDIIFCCVSDKYAVKEILFGHKGVLNGFENCKPKSKSYVEMTSLEPETSIEMAEVVESAGMMYLEACIVGSKQTADAGELVILASGDRNLFYDCGTVFHAISKHAYYQSASVGHSSKLRVIASAYVGTVYATLAEAMALTERMKLSQRDLADTLGHFGYASERFLEKANSIVRDNYAPDTLLKHQQKDMKTALQLSDTYDQPMTVTRQANEMYKQAQRLGCSDFDAAAVYHGCWY